MPLTSGSRIGGYEITSVIGAGGMGEVYRAVDTKLGRAVALKVLSETFTGDAERLARFEREAKTLAALNHPHIAHVYGLEDGPSGHALVMELVDGEDLAQRIARGAIPIDEALRIASQIAEAIEAAHEQGVIHRDLKPANIRVTPEGIVKVLDFGLAKSITGSTGSTSSTGSAGATGSTGRSGSTGSMAVTSPAMTQAGMILGTAAYMSPEQAHGRPADKRSDVWAFGCVLFEMLTGKRAFEGHDVVDTLAAVVRAEPDWRAWPANAPPMIRLLVQSCLIKDRRERVSDIAAARYALRHASGSPEEPVGTAAAATRTRPTWWIAAAATSTLLAAGLGVMLWRRPDSPPAARPIAHLSMMLPAERPYWPSGVDRDFAITPDGSRIVYRSLPGGSLAVRMLDSPEVRTLAGTENSRGPFVSPDGQWVGFWSAGSIKKVPVSGGQAVRVAQSSVAPRGHVWAADDTIIFATNAGEGLYRVPASGGQPEVLTTLAPGEQGHVLPTMLPDGVTVLFTVLVGGVERTQVASFNVRTRERRLLLSDGAQPLYLEPGILLYRIRNTMQAVRFELDTLAVVGDAVTVLDSVATTNTGSMGLDLADDGTLVFVSGGVQGSDRSLAWVDRTGRFTPIEGPQRTYVFPRVSPDGSRIVVDTRDQEQDVWIAATKGGGLTRLSFGPSLDAYPIWAADGRSALFASSREGRLAVFRQSADGTGGSARVAAGAPGEGLPLSVSPDGKLAIVRRDGDLCVLSLDGRGLNEPLMKTPSTELNAEVSPDGRWLAFDSDESGQSEVYVRPFPNVNDGRWQISSGSGSKPVWARHGQELFYEDNAGAVFTVTYASTPGFSSGVPKKLFDGQTTFRGASTGRTWDVGPDGRFLMVRDPALDTKNAVPFSIVLNWAEEVRAKLPPARQK